MTSAAAIIEELRTRNPAPPEPLAGLGESDQATAMLERILDRRDDTQPAHARRGGAGRTFHTARRRAIIVFGIVAAAMATLVVVGVAPLSSPPRSKPAVPPLPSKLSDTVVLGHAAELAAAQPLGPTPAPGQFLYVKTLTGATEVGSKSTPNGTAPGWAYEYNASQERWMAPNGSGRTKITAEPVTFLTPQDQARWAASGATKPTSPSTNGTVPPGSFPFPNSANLSTTPAALEQAIVTQWLHGRFSPLGVFGSIGGILEEGASPQLRAALFKVIERLPGVQNLGPMTDRLGRSGVGVGLTDNGIQGQLIFDPATSAVLEYQTVVVAPVGTTLSMSLDRPTPLPDGTALNYTVYLATGIATSTSSVPSHLYQQP